MLDERVLVSFDDLFDVLYLLGKTMRNFGEAEEKVPKIKKPFNYLPKKNHYIKNTAPAYKIERMPQKNQPYQRRSY